MRNRRVTAPLTLVRILSRLQKEGHAKDISFIAEAYFPDDGTVSIRGHSVYSGEMEWRSVHWDEDWDIAG